MAFTYNPAQINPSAGSSPSSVRFLLQDVNATAPEFTDEEIAAVKAGRPTTETEAIKVYRTASILAAAKARWYGRVGTISSDGKTVDVKSIKANWQEMAMDFALVAQSLETNDALTVIQGGRLPFESLDGQIGGDGWML